MLIRGRAPAGSVFGIRGVASTVALLAALAVAPTASASEASLAMQDCHLDVVQFADDHERLREYVPAGYELAAPVSFFSTSEPLPAGPGDAGLVAFGYSCGALSIDGGRPRPTILTLIGVLIRTPQAMPLNGINRFDSYVVWAHTNNGELADVLSAAGLRARHTRDMTFTQTKSLIGMPSERIDVGWRQSPFSMIVGNPLINDTARTHPHDNAFFHGSDPARAARLRMVVPAARDWFCAGGPDCSSISAEEGTPIAEFLGSHHRHDAVFGADHELIRTINGTVTSGG